MLFDACVPRAVKCNAVKYLCAICERRDYRRIFSCVRPARQNPDPGPGSDPPGAANDSPNGWLRCEYPFEGEKLRPIGILRSADAAELQGKTV